MMDRATRRPDPLWQRLLPGLAVLRDYRRSWLRGDLLAGLTVAAYLIPQVMAYAEVAGLPAVTGLWACLAPLLVYALAGSSRRLSIGPESTTALMTAVAVAALVDAAGPGRYAEVAAVLAIAVGVVCVLGRLARLGFLADLLSRPVLIGYMAGIAVLMIASQIGKVTGRPVLSKEPLPQIWEGLTHLSQAHLPTLLLALAVLTALFGLARFAPSWPGPLLAMLAAAAVVAGLHLQERGIAVVGAVPAGLPTPRVPQFGEVELGLLLPAALGIAVVGYSDNVLTARAFARDGERVNADTELLGLGLANVAAGLTQGFPVSSSGSRTVLGAAMGAATQVYSLVVALMVVLTMFVAGPVLAAFPTAALGAVVLYAAIRLIDVAEFRRLYRFRFSEFALAMVTMVAVVALDVLAGIGVAIALSLADLLRRISSPHDAVLGYVPGVAGMHDVEDYPVATQVPGLVVYRFDAPLFFANADRFYARAVAAVEGTAQPVRWFVLNAESNTQVDLTAVDALDHLRRDLAERGIEFAMARVTFEVHERLRRAGLVDKVGQDRIFATLPTAVQAYLDWHEQRFASLPPVPVLGPGMVWRPHPADRREQADRCELVDRPESLRRRQQADRREPSRRRELDGEPPAAPGAA